MGVFSKLFGGTMLNATMVLAKGGDAEAQCNMGAMYALGQGVPQDYEQAMIWFRKAADQGNAVAQCNLGILYANGLGTLQDPTLAMRWFRFAADQGNVEAKRYLDHFLASGLCDS